MNFGKLQSWMSCEGDTFLTWLRDVEQHLLKMVSGIWFFIVEQIPAFVRRLLNWLNEKFIYTCRVAIRLGRVTAILGTWLMIVFGPVVIWTDFWQVAG